MRTIARIHSEFTQKFGIPRQSGLATDTRALIVFEPEYRIHEALRGLEEYSHIWILWVFSENIRAGFSPTVRPPRLGGNARKGVFATRSPFRPNPIGLSCVQLLGIEKHPEWGEVLCVAGADLMDGTPILDIKPYVAYADSYPNAVSGFASSKPKQLNVHIPDELCLMLPHNTRMALVSALSFDPRPAYQHDEAGREYAFEFSGFDIHFTIADDTVEVISIKQKLA